MARALRFPIVLNEEQAARYWSRVNKNGPKGCWLWTGQVDPFGYGLLSVRQRRLKTHRIGWTLANGPIPDDEVVDHLCRVPACVNPAHLELVSNRENILRGVSPQALNARKTHCQNGHLLSPENLLVHRGVLAGHRTCRLCRLAYRSQRRLLAKASK